MKLISKYIYHSLIKKHFFKYLLIFAIIILPLVLFLPIIKAETDFLHTHQQFYGEKKFDKYFKLPDKKTFLKFQKYNSFSSNIFPDISDQKNSYAKVSIPNYVHNYFIPKMKKELKGSKTLSYALVHKIFTYVFSQKNQFFLQNGNFNQTTFVNKFKITDGRLPLSQNYIKREKNNYILEAVLNTKYAKLNKIKLNSLFFLKDNLQIKIVGFVDFSYHLSLDLKATVIAKNSPIQYQKSTDNIYANLGFIYLTNQDFWRIINNNFFFNYDSFLYLKSDATTFQKTQFYNFVENNLANDFNYFTKKTDYFFDVSSGLKTTFAKIKIFFILIITLILVFFLCFFSIFIVHQSLTKKDFLLGFLNSFGYSKVTLAKNYFFVHFFPFAFFSIVGYCLSFILDKSLFLDNQKLFFIHLEYQPFSLLFFFSSFCLFAFFPSFAVFLFVYFYLSQKTGKWLTNENEIITPSSWFFQFKIRLFNFFKKITFFHFIPIKLKLGISFFFQDFWKKILFFFFLFLLFFSGLVIIFSHIASENFLNKQWKFLQPHVKNFTRLKNALFFDKNSKSIVSSYKFKPFYEKDYEDIEIDKITEAVKLISTTCALLQKKAEQRECYNAEIIKKLQDKRIVLSSISQKSQFAFLKELNFGNIYFHTVPYVIKEDLPVLALDSYTLNQKKTNSSFYFLSPGWENFLQITELDEVMPGFRFQSYKDDNCPLVKCLKIGRESDSEGIPYLLAPYYLKEQNYQVGDVLDFKFSLDNNIDIANQPRKFKIAGFIKKSLLYQNIFFADYESFFTKNFPVSEDKIYNLIFSQNPKSHLQRNIILDLTFILNSVLDIFFSSTPENTKLNNAAFDLGKISIFNNDSIQLKTFNNVLFFHVKGVKKYINMIMIALILLSILFLFLIIFIWFDQKNNVFPLLKTFGYNWLFFFFWFFFIQLFLIALALLILFLICWFLYQDFTLFLITKNIFFYLFSLWEYFGYFLLTMFLIFFFCCCNNFFFFKKIKKINF